MKQCTKCGAEKPTSEFYKGSSRANYKDGLSPWCKACARDYQREQRQRDPEKVRASRRESARKWRAKRADYTRDVYRAKGWKKHVFRTYGLTDAGYSSLLAQQHGRCRICFSEPDPGQRLHVDHDHDTGEVRALLCRRCNTLLGMARDESYIIESALQYLDDFKRTAVIMKYGPPRTYHEEELSLS